MYKKMRRMNIDNPKIKLMLDVVKNVEIARLLRVQDF